MRRSTTWVLALAVAASGATLPDAAYAAAKTAKKSPEARFAKLDSNNDEQLSLEEFIGKRTDARKEKAQKQFRKRDKDGNQSLSLEEFKTPPKKKKKTA
jgi:hypothetical protein